MASFSTGQMPNGTRPSQAQFASSSSQTYDHQFSEGFEHPIQAYQEQNGNFGGGYGAPVAPMMHALGLGSGTPESVRQRLPDPPRFDDANEFRIFMPSVQQVHNTMQQHMTTCSILNQQLCDRLEKLEKTSNKLLAFSQELVAWSDRVRAMIDALGQDSGITIRAGEGEDTRNSS